MRIYKLSDLCTFTNGGAWSDSEYVSEGIPVIKVSNLKNSEINTDNIDYLSEKSLKKYQKNELKTHDVIVATVGSHPSLESSAAGRSVVVNELHSGYLLNQNAVCIRSKKPKLLDQKFLGYIAKSENFYHYIQNRGSGAANQMRIPIEEIKSFSTCMPSLTVQKKIVKLISCYDDLIENNRKYIELLEESLRITYEEWFINFRIGDKKLDIDSSTNLPFGWKDVFLTDYIDFDKGVEPGSDNYEEIKTDNNIAFLRVGDLNKRNSKIYVSKKLTKNKIVNENDVLISLDGSPGLVKFGMYGSYSAGVRKVKSKQKNISNIFIFNLLNSQHIQKLIEVCNVRYFFKEQIK